MLNYEPSTRDLQLKAWLEKVCPLKDGQLSALKGDASFRRYFRYQNSQRSFIVMDAPPEKENPQYFAQLGQYLKEIGMPVPDIEAANIQDGFLILSDLGDTVLSDCITLNNVDQYYKQAIDILVSLQKSSQQNKKSLPLYNKNLIQGECDLFTQWYINQYLQMSLSETQLTLIQETINSLEKIFADQPQVFVHRDYHSRNIMVQGKHLKLIDFQDAVLGPITYDLASLLKDCYLDWPQDKIQNALNYYYQKAKFTHVLGNMHLTELEKYFDLTGLQRHLKCLGIFSRLGIRDQKTQYYQYLPRVWRYIADVTKRYPELADFADLIEKVKPQEKECALP